eukprot:gene3600-biopygen2956
MATVENWEAVQIAAADPQRFSVRDWRANDLAGRNPPGTRPPPAPAPPPGLAPADLAKLFVPFERRTASPTGRESSHGLGLSIAHEIVRLHGGEIRVESAPARGATFFVDLPVVS